MMLPEEVKESPAPFLSLAGSGRSVSCRFLVDRIGIEPMTSSMPEAMKNLSY